MKQKKMARLQRGVKIPFEGYKEKDPYFGYFP
jgi:hypothetical protein